MPTYAELTGKKVTVQFNRPGNTVARADGIVHAVDAGARKW